MLRGASAGHAFRTDGPGGHRQGAPSLGPAAGPLSRTPESRGVTVPPEGSARSRGLATPPLPAAAIMKAGQVGL